MYESKYHYDNKFFKNPIMGDDFYIYQLGELYSNENTAFKEHRQICDEISLILSGRGCFYLTEKGITCRRATASYRLRTSCMILKAEAASRCDFISAVLRQKAAGRKE